MIDREGFAYLAVALVTIVIAIMLAARVSLALLQGLGPGRDAVALRAEVSRLALESARLSKALEECRKEKDGSDRGPRAATGTRPRPEPDAMMRDGLRVGPLMLYWYWPITSWQFGFDWGVYLNFGPLQILVLE